MQLTWHVALMKTLAQRVSKRLSEVLAGAPELAFNDSSKFIFFSDCHRGDNSAADEFAPNQPLFLHALTQYFEQGYSYIEVGDGDELMKNKSFEVIRRAHQAVFDLMRRFHEAGRLYMVYGNHDLVRRNPEVVARTLHQYFDEARKRIEPLFAGIEVYEGLRLHHAPSNQSFLVVHGHQGDLIDETLHRAGKFLVRHVWRRMQQSGIQKPGVWYSAWRGRNSKGGDTCGVNLHLRAFEQRLAAWARSQGLPLITGHSHRPIFAPSVDTPVFNCGSCVQRDQISGLEVSDGTISLVNWSAHAGIFVREVVAGPMDIGTFARAVPAH